MNYVSFYGLKPADKIVVPKSWVGIIQHHVIYLGQNYLGQHLIGENVIGGFTRVVTAEQFFAENPVVTRIERFDGTSIERKKAIERALEKLGQPYDLINFNCEHFANYAQTGVMESNQVGWGLLVLAVITMVVIAD